VEEEGVEGQSHHERTRPRRWAPNQVAQRHLSRRSIGLAPAPWPGKFIMGGRQSGLLARVARPGSPRSAPNQAVQKIFASRGAAGAMDAHGCMPSCGNADETKARNFTSCRPGPIAHGVVLAAVRDKGEPVGEPEPAPSEIGGAAPQTPARALQLCCCCVAVSCACASGMVPPSTHHTPLSPEKGACSTWP